MLIMKRVRGPRTRSSFTTGWVCGIPRGCARLARRSEVQVAFIERPRRRVSTYRHVNLSHIRLIAGK